MKKLFFFIAVVAGLALCGQESAAQSWDTPTAEGNNVTVRPQENRVSGTAKSQGFIPKGYRGMAEVALGYGFGFASLFSTTHGYQFNPHVFLGGMFGLGSGINYDDEYGYDDTDLAIRVAVDSRFYITKTRIAPFFGAQVGFELDDDGDGFAYLNAGFGARFALKKKSGLSATLQFGNALLWVTPEIKVRIGFEF